MPLRFTPEQRKTLKEFLRTTTLFDKPRRTRFRFKEPKPDILPTAGAIMERLEKLGSSFGASRKQHRQLLYDTMGQCAGVIAMLDQKPKLRADVQRRFVESRKLDDRTAKFDLETELVAVATGKTGKSRKLANKHARVICHLLAEGIDPDDVSGEIRKRGLEKIYRASVRREGADEKEKGTEGMVFSARITKSDRERLLEDCHAGDRVIFEVVRTGKGSSEFKIVKFTICRQKAGNGDSEDWAA
jgi:hypothetical protein